MCRKRCPDKCTRHANGNSDGIHAKNRRLFRYFGRSAGFQVSCKSPSGTSHCRPSA
jgi:hypothetical protein